jgi:hypothetical protein
MTDYIFDSKGRWRAFIHGRNVFTAKDCQWIGYVHSDQQSVYSPMGTYIGELKKTGTIFRLVKKVSAVPKFGRIAAVPPVPPIPPIPPVPSVPRPLPAGWDDVFCI